MTDLAPEYITARRVLLDALTALEGHLVGAGLDVLARRGHRRPPARRRIDLLAQRLGPQLLGPGR